MYRRPKFLEILLEIREQMSRDADFDVDLFAELVRSGKITEGHDSHSLAPAANGVNGNGSAGNGDKQEA
jgi:hypothetical protein